MNKSYTLIQTFCMFEPKEVSKVKTFRNIYNAFDLMNKMARDEFEKILYTTSRASMQLCSDSRYPDAWGFANNVIQVFKDNNLIYEFEVIETKDINEYVNQ